MTYFLKPSLIAAATLLVACSPSTDTTPAAAAVAVPEATPAPAPAKPPVKAPAKAVAGGDDGDWETF